MFNTPDDAPQPEVTFASAEPVQFVNLVSPRNWSTVSPLIVVSVAMAAFVALEMSGIADWLFEGLANFFNGLRRPGR